MYRSTREADEATRNSLHLLESLGKTGDIVHNRLDVALGEHGLSAAKFSILRHLVQSVEPLPLGKLADNLACVKSNITQLVDRLEEDGLVRRIPDSEDRRCMRAALTAEGRRRYELGMEAESRVQRELLQNLSLDEQAQLAMILERLGACKRRA